MLTDEHDHEIARQAMRRYDAINGHRRHDDLGLWIVAIVILAFALWIASCLPPATH